MRPIPLRENDSRSTRTEIPNPYSRLEAVLAVHDRLRMLGDLLTERYAMVEAAQVVFITDQLAGQLERAMNGDMADVEIVTRSLTRTQLVDVWRPVLDGSGGRIGGPT